MKGSRLLRNAIQQREADTSTEDVKSSCPSGTRSNFRYIVEVLYWGNVSLTGRIINYTDINSEISGIPDHEVPYHQTSSQKTLYHHPLN